MPSSSDELRAIMEKRFGSIDSDGPMRFLLSRGYKVTKGWLWLYPTPKHKETQDETECIVFLIEEWDWGDCVKTYPGPFIYDKPYPDASRPKHPDST